MNWLQTLYKRSGANVLTQWRVGFESGQVITEHGRVGGKQAVSRTVAKGTNIGRANARDPVAQAAFEASAAWKKKFDEGYVTDAKLAEIPLLPMLAQRFDKHGHKLRYPCDAQPKLNGLRCFAVRRGGAVELISRGNQVWRLPHIATALAPTLGEGDIADGEIYVHGMRLQKIQSLASRPREESLVLQFHCYDVTTLDAACGPWSARKRLLAGLWDAARGGVVREVPTKTVHSEDEVRRMEEWAHLEGYEGIMLRNHHGEYRFDYRSYDLLKFKRFSDAEFTILDVTSRPYGVGGDMTMIADVFVLQNDTSSDTFEAMPRGTFAEKQEYLADRESLIGTLATVRYLERSADEIPTGNPVVVGIRLYDDTGEQPETEEDEE